MLLLGGNQHYNNYTFLVRDLVYPYEISISQMTIDLYLFKNKEDNAHNIYPLNAPPHIVVLVVLFCRCRNVQMKEKQVHDNGM